MASRAVEKDSDASSITGSVTSSTFNQFLGYLYGSDDAPARGHSEIVKRSASKNGVQAIRRELGPGELLALRAGRWVRSFFFLSAFAMALFPSFMKIYETSHWFREGDPSVYDNAKDWFSNPNLPFQAYFDNSKVLMRVYFFIIPYIVSSACVAIGLAIPVAPPRGKGFKQQRRVLGSVLRRTFSFPRPLVRIGMPHRVSLAEVLGVLFFVALNITTLAVRVRRSLPRGSRKIEFLVDSDKDASREPIDPISWQACEVWAKTLGVISIMNLGWYLLMPVGRKSVLLEALNVSWERAIKYHRWVGYWSVNIMVIHSLMYVAIWIHGDGHHDWDPEGTLVERNMVPWYCSSNECDEGQARMLRINMYGFVTLFLILVMTVFTLPWVRRQRFEWFFYAHHLFLLVLVFVTLHYKGSIIYLLPGIAIYGVDKLMSLYTYRKAAPVATRVLSSDVLEISFKVGPGVVYNAGDYVFLNVPAVSALQWHPFSVTSAPSANGNHVFFHLKGCGAGSWTQDIIEEAIRQGGHSLRVRLDGFYGVNSDICGKLQDGKDGVILVGGGIGVTPMMSLAMEMCETSQIPVTLMWTVRSIDEFSIFSDELTSAQSSHEHFNARAYVTLSSLTDASMGFSKTELLEFKNFRTSLRSFKDSIRMSSRLPQEVPTFVMDQTSLSGVTNALAMTLSTLFALFSYALAVKMSSEAKYEDTAQDYISLMELSMACMFVLLWVLAMITVRFYLAVNRSAGDDEYQILSLSDAAASGGAKAKGKGKDLGSYFDEEAASSDDLVLQKIVEGSIGSRPYMDREFSAFAAALAEEKGRPVDISVLACGPIPMIKSINDYVNVPSNSCSLGIEPDQQAFFSFIEEDWEW